MGKLPALQLSGERVSQCDNEAGLFLFFLVLSWLGWQRDGAMVSIVVDVKGLQILKCCFAAHSCTC